MGDVYRDAYVTIAAEAATSVAEGCIIRQPVEPDIPPFRIGWLSREERIGGAAWLYFDRQKEHERAPLDTRGWCFQESLLAPRYLRFSENTISLDCQDLKIQNRSDQTRLAHNFFGTAHLAPAPSHEENAREKDLHYNWRSTVTRYSLRNLTYTSDKLPAIGGIASQFAKLTGDIYHAGCWWSSIARDIMFTTSGEEGRVTPYRAPSWSWASYNGRIDWPNDHEVSATLVVAAVTSLSSTISPPFLNPYGTVTSGYIRLEAQFRAVRIQAGQRLQLVNADGSFEGENTSVVSLDYYPYKRGGNPDAVPTSLVFAVRILKFAGLLLQVSTPEDPVISVDDVPQVSYVRIGRWDIKPPFNLASIMAPVRADHLLGTRDALTPGHEEAVGRWWDGVGVQNIWIV